MKIVKFDEADKKYEKNLKKCTLNKLFYDIPKIEVPPEPSNSEGSEEE
jgi:hypothetical protein